MTKLLDQAIAVARDLPADMQDDLARILLQLTGQPNEIVALTRGEQDAVALSKAAALRGDFATDEQVPLGLGQARAVRCRCSLIHRV